LKKKVICDTCRKALEIRKQNTKPCIRNRFERLDIPTGGQCPLSLTRLRPVKKAAQ
jgi:hypothetical protein